MRIRATRNVAKITNVMKLVASSKLRGVEEQLYRGRAFGVSRNYFCSNFFCVLDDQKKMYSFVNRRLYLVTLCIHTRVHERVICFFGHVASYKTECITFHDVHRSCK
jgi:hypothetical protein